MTPTPRSTAGACLPCARLHPTYERTTTRTMRTPCTRHARAMRTPCTRAMRTPCARHAQGHSSEHHRPSEVAALMQPVFRGRYRLSGKTYLGGSAIVKIGVDEKTKAEVSPLRCTCSAYAYDLYTPCTRHARAMHTRCTRDAHVVAIELHARAVTLTPTRTLTRTLTRTQTLTRTPTQTQNQILP